MIRLLAVASISIGLVAQSAPADGSIEDFIESEMSASGVPGLSYAVVSDGEIKSVGAYGVLRLGGDEEITPNTPFLAGSITKSFTALAIMQLIERGEIDLDMQLSRYLEVFGNQPSGVITIRQLLSHTSGFSTLQGNSSDSSVASSDDELERTVDLLTGVAPAYGPDERWEYSNTNYQILGRVIEVVSGEEYQAYIQSNILDRLGMNDSFVADGETHDSMATGHRPWFGGRRPLAGNLTDRGTAPQGGVISSAHDLAIYMQMMMNGEDDVLSAAGKTQMMSAASETSPFYGFGWFLDSADESVSHGGSTPGVETLAVMIPAERSGAVVLVNRGSGMGFGETTELRNGIVARALALNYEGEGSRWFQKAVFLSLAFLPFIYLLSMVWAWHRRADIRAKHGAFGLFSLWFPLLTTLAAAVVILWLVPNTLGAPLSVVGRFQPDLGLALTATAVFGVLWAVFRLVVAYSGEGSSGSSASISQPDRNG